MWLCGCAGGKYNPFVSLLAYITLLINPITGTTPKVRKDILDDVIRGNIILISGKLVNVNKIGNKWTWKSSTKRDDTGSGACEILWVEEISIIQ